VASSGDPLHARWHAVADHLAGHDDAAPSGGGVLRCPRRTRRFCRLVRVHDLEGAPLSVVITYLPRALASVLTRTALRQPIHALLWQRCGLFQRRSVHKVGIGAPTPRSRPVQSA